MRTVVNNEKIEVFGVTFDGIKEVITYARNLEPKDGGYVALDNKSYPCFDSEDYASENRRYWNFVFAKNQEEVLKKLKLLNQQEPKMNYNKLNPQLHPMAYWEGDTHHAVIMTEDNDE